MLTPARKAWLENLAAARAAELRMQRAMAKRVYRADHPTLASLNEQALLAEAALQELRAIPAQVAA